MKSLKNTFKIDSPIKLQAIKKQSKTISVKLVDRGGSNSQLPKLADVAKSDVEDIFIRKLQLCSKTYDFLEDTMMKEKQNKFLCLKELTQFVSERGNIGVLSESTYQLVLNMISTNIFRAFPRKEHTDYDPEYDEQELEASWPHLKLVYEFFLHFMNSPEINMSFLRKIIDRQFITQLLELFDTEDIRERKSLKNLLLSIYLKFFEQREFIRKMIRNIFLNYIYEEEQFNGISELLEILSMAINGYNVPLRQEHKEFFAKVLLPLHKPKYIIFYQRALVECLKGFIKKEEQFAEDTIMGLLKFWPKTNTEKQSLFLQEIGELADVIPSEQFVKIQEPLMKQVSASISSLHFQVAETALNLWDKPAFERLVNENLNEIMPIIFPELLRVSKNHWNHGISELASGILRTFYDDNPVLFNQFLALSKFKLKKKS